MTNIPRWRGDAVYRVNDRGDHILVSKVRMVEGSSSFAKDPLDQNRSAVEPLFQPGDRIAFASDHRVREITDVKRLQAAGGAIDNLVYLYT